MLSAYDLSVVVFTNPHCGPCLLQQRELQHIPVPVLMVDIVQWPRIGSRYGVASLPCVLIVKHQSIVERWDGLTPKNELLQTIAHYSSPNSD